jgi:hypothetical protein
MELQPGITSWAVLGDYRTVMFRGLCPCSPIRVRCNGELMLVGRTGQDGQSTLPAIRDSWLGCVVHFDPAPAGAEIVVHE